MGSKPNQIMTRTRNSELNTLRQSVLDLKSELSSLKSTHDKVLDQNLILQVDLNFKLKEETEKREKAAKKYEVKVRKLEKELSSVSSAIIDKTNEVEEVRDKLSKANAQILVLQNDLRSDRDKLKLLVIENEELSKPKTSLGDSYENILKANKTLENWNKNLSEEKKYLEIFNHGISERNDSLKSENERLSKKAKKLELERFRGCKKACEVEHFEVKKLKQKLQNKSSTLKEKIANNYELKTRVKTLKRQLTDAKIQVETLQKQVADHKNQSDTDSKTIATLKTRVVQSENKEQRTNAAVNMMRLQIDAMSKEKDAMHWQLKKMSESVHYGHFIVTNGELKGEIELLKKQLHENASLIVTQKEEISHKQFVVEFVKKDLAKLENESKEKDWRLSVLKTQLTEKVTMLTIQKERITSLEMLADCYKNSLARISADGTVNHSLQTLVAQLQVANEQVQTLSLKNNILEHALNNGVATRLDHLPSERSHFQAQVEGFQSQGLPEMASELNQSFGTQSSKLVASNAVNNLRFEIRPLAKLTGLTPENKRQQATTSKRARWAL